MVGTPDWSLARLGCVSWLAPQPESYWGNVDPIGLSSVYDEAKRFGEAATMASAQTGPINCGAEFEMTVRDLADLIVRLTGSDSEVVLVERTVDDPERRRPDRTLARTLLKYEPAVEPEVGLARTIEDFRRRLGVS